MHDDDSTWTVDTEKGVSLRARKVRVEILRGPLEGQILELSGPEVCVGSGKNSDLVIPDRTVSHHHATLRIEKDAIRVIDLRSRNGTLVDDVRIRDAFARPDSTISMGASAMRLRMIEDVVELPLSTKDHFGRLIGASVAMRRVYALLERISDTDLPILIEGETGTGKELVAAAIHEASQRSKRQIVTFDCSAVSPELMESELFGHVANAFTGAKERKGIFREADGGTLFLDELGELPIDLQPKLLRALESSKVRPVGADKAIKVNVRVVAATNRTLATEVDRGRFREDLYYRLAIVPVRLPPLRERVDDIPLLVRHFECEWRNQARPSVPLPDHIIEAMKQRSWPGNVRELRNKVNRLLLLGHTQADAELPSTSVETLKVDLAMPFHVWRERVVDAQTKAYFAAMLEKTGGNVSRAAEAARVSRAFLQREMRRLGLRQTSEGDGESREMR